MTSQINETVFLQHHYRVLKANEAAKTASSKLQDETKKGIEVGINEQARKHALKIAKMDPLEQFSYVNDLITYLGYMRATVGQVLLPVSFDTKAAKVKSDYFAEGFSTSALALDRDKCPHDINSDQGRSWMEGYEAHQHHLLGNVRTLKPKAKAEEKPAAEAAAVAAAPAEGKRRPGRPRKDAPPATVADTPAGDEEKDEGDQFEASEAELSQQKIRPVRDIPPPPPATGRTIPGALQ